MYIRTEDSVYDTSKGLYTPSIKMWAIGTVTIYDEDILKQSENLADLCDRAFAFHKDSPWKSPDLEDFSLDSLKEEILESTKNTIDEFIFKLAIWTDSGLTYVAKADGKGDLVLI